MSLRPTDPRSIATQLVLLFTVAAALLLACGLIVLYAIVVHHTSAEDDAVLQDKMRGIGAELKEPDRLGELAGELKSRPGEEAMTFWVRVIDPAGSIVAQTPKMEEALPRDLFPAQQRSTSAVPPSKQYRSGEHLFSLMTSQSAVNGQPYTIQIAQDRSADERFENQFRALLAVVLAGGVIASAAIAIIVTTRGLRPLAKMTRSLERVGPSHLSERVSRIAWPHELQPLAVAFDNMLERLEYSFTRLSQFSADLAHELRTPIANILGETQVTLSRARSAGEYRAVLESNVAECERLSGIVDNLLFLARAEAAERQVQRAILDGRAAVEKIVGYYQTLAEDRHLTIDCTGDAKICADPTLLNRALSNLIDNAIRFTPDGGTIRIAITDCPDHSEISVTDNGCGIAPEHLPRIFDRFFRADPSRTVKGTGLGLALVKSIADLHGGSVTIDSQLNRGTRASLRFPKPMSTKETPA